MTRAVRLPRPLPHQIDILRSPARFKVAVCGRRFGKTMLGLVAVLTGHGAGRCFRGALQGGNVWWVAPTFGIAAKIWRDLKAAVRAWPDLAKNEVEKRLEFPGGGSVTVKSAHDPDALRGEGLDGIVFDEAAFAPETAWTLALRPALADRQGWAIFITTPNGQDWVYRLWKRGQPPGEDGWGSWRRPTADNARIAAAEIEAARETLSDFAYRREFLAEFVVAAGGLFDRRRLTYYDAVPPVAIVFATADLAISTKTHANYTAAGKFGRAPDGVLYLLDVFRRRVEGARLVDTLASLVAEWKALRLILAAGGPLQVLNVQASSAGLPVLELPEVKDKFTRAQPVAAAMEHGRLRLPRSAPWLTDLLDELEGFTGEPGGEDDQVDMLSLAVAASPSGETPESPPPYRRRESDDEDRPRWRIGR